MISCNKIFWGVLLTLLIFIQPATAISVSPDVEFQLDQSAVTYASAQDFDSIIVESNTLAADNKSISISATNPLNVAIQNFNGSYIVYNISSALENEVTMQFSQLESSKPWSIYSDNILYTTERTNSGGVVTYSYHDSGLSDHLFELAPSDDVQITTTETMTVNSAIDAIVVAYNQNSFYNTITSSIQSGYTLGALMVLALGASAILRFLGFV